MKKDKLQSTLKEQLVTEKKTAGKISGFLLMETVLSSSLFLIVVTAFVGAYIYGMQTTTMSGSQSQGIRLAEEGLEAVRSMRDDGFSAISDGTYGLAIVNNKWAFSGTSDVTGIYTRQILVSTIDANRRNISSHVFWTQNGLTGSTTLTSRITNWQSLTSGGGGGGGSWSNPQNEFSVDMSGSSNGIEIQIQGNYAYVVRSTGVDFSVIQISTTSTSTVVASLSIAGTLSNLFVKDNYAYLTSNDNTAELTIVNIATPTAPVIVGSYNDFGNQNANSVFVVGNYAYLAMDGDDEFTIVNVATPTAPAYVGSTNLTSNINDLIVEGNFAYLASTNNDEELQIINIATPTAPVKVGGINLATNADGFSLNKVGNYVYLGQGDTLQVVNVASSTAPVFVTSMSLGGEVNDIARDLASSTSLLFLATDQNSAEFKVINISSSTAPVLYGQEDAPGPGDDNLRGVAYSLFYNLVIGVGGPNPYEAFVFTPN